MFDFLGKYQYWSLEDLTGLFLAQNFQKRNGQYIYDIFGYTFENVLSC